MFRWLYPQASVLRRLLIGRTKVSRFLTDSLAKIPSDSSLLRRFRAGDDGAATALFQRYAPRLHSLARRECASGLARCVDADDIVQSVFCAFFERARKGYYDIPDGQDLWQLMLVIALNKVRTKRSHHQAARRDIRLTASEQHLESRGQEAAPDAQLLRLAFAESLALMTEQERQMVELLIQGHEVAEIATRVGRSKRTIERNLQSIRHRLSLLLEEDLSHDR
jgi:RNA polymerase sigma-70 factor, ECF subfamily